MTYLFIFAHPDDETVACAGTMKQLIDQGDRVIVVSVTDGAAGEVLERAKLQLKKAGSLSQLRRQELKHVCELIGVHELKILDFVDGQITNQQVWGELKENIIEVVNTYKPDVMVTFDHTGWYFHLDHVGTSIATTLAFHEATHRPDALFFAFMQVKGVKWKYVFPKTLPLTHRVNATEHRDLKLKALDLHASQDTGPVRRKVEHEKKHWEIYQLAFATPKGKKTFRHHPIFRTVTSKMGSGTARKRSLYSSSPRKKS